MKKITARKEDFYAQATLIVNDREIPSVPCKVYLPDRIDEKPQIEFRPQKEQYDKIVQSHRGIFKAEILGFDKRPEVSIEAPEIYFRDMSTTYWGPNLSESTVSGDPQNLKVIRHRRESGLSEKTSLILWISPNMMLSPAMTQTPSYMGTIEIKRIEQLRFEIEKGIILTFDTHFRSKNVTDKKLLRWSFLVACTEVDTPAHDVETLREKLLPDIDVFLLVASLGSRTRTGCLGVASFRCQDRYHLL